MDIEKLIEQLRKSADFEDYPIVASFAAIIEKKYLRDAATALSTLQAENEKLRAELENYRKGHCSEGGCAAEKDRDLIIAENEKLRADMTDLLVQNQALRNAANGFKARCEELEAKNRRLEEARENANEACAKWEGLYRAELEKKSAWISVRDILPEKGVCVLVRAKTKFAAGESICIDRLENGEKRPVWFYTHGWYEVTHWMPLPLPPESRPPEGEEDT